jgi:hypothetical protein
MTCLYRCVVLMETGPDAAPALFCFSSRFFFSRYEAAKLRFLSTPALLPLGPERIGQLARLTPSRRALSARTPPSAVTGFCHLGKWPAASLTARNCKDLNGKIEVLIADWRFMRVTPESVRRIVTALELLCVCAAWLAVYVLRAQIGYCGPVSWQARQESPR